MSVVVEPGRKGGRQRGKQLRLKGTSQLGHHGRNDKVNPLLNECPVCEAGRYYRCWVYVGTGEGRYLAPLERVHPERLKNA